MSWRKLLRISEANSSDSNILFAFIDEEDLINHDFTGAGLYKLSLSPMVMPTLPKGYLVFKSLDGS